MYLDSTRFDHLVIARQRPSYKSWKASLIKERETLEIEKVGLGNVDLRIEDDEGFLGVENNQESSTKEVIFKLIYQKLPQT